MFKVFLFLIAGLFFFSADLSFAQNNPENQFNPETPKETLYKAKVLEVVEEGERGAGEFRNKYQDLRLELLDGPNKGKIIALTHGDLVTLSDELLLDENDKVVVLEFSRPDQSTEYIVTDRYRLDKLVIAAVLFVLIVLAIARWKGIGSLIGLGISFVVIINFIIPQILDGQDPLLISIIGASAIMLSTLYLAHGFSKRTTVALISTIITFIFIGILSVVFVNVAKITGLGSEDAYSLQYGFMNDINFKGLFLGGILIGALGVLDDVTTSLTTAIFEIAKNNKTKSVKKLFKSGMEIGREHIASLVNTLVLAYAGAGLPLFLFIVINPAKNPAWSILNSELIAEEIVRVFAGSFGLILAVPLTALLASYTAIRLSKN